MKRHPILLRSVLALFAWILFHSFSMGLPADEKIFNRQWQRVDSLDKAGLPKSALEVVGDIYNLAKEQQNEPQQAKAVIWKLKLEGQFREDYYSYAVKLLQSEISSSAGQLPSIYHSLLAEIYQNYYTRNAYRFSDRTPLSTVREDSIQTWDLAKLSAGISREYLASLKEPERLKVVPVSKFSLIMESKTAEKDDKTIDPGLRPTLYDFLLQRALDYFTSAGIGNSGKADTVSKETTALKLYQEAAVFHFKDANPRVYLSYELDRLKYIHENSGLGSGDTVYTNALRDLESRYVGHSASSSVSFARAWYLYEQGGTYDPLISQDHKWDLKKAVEVCENAIRRYPDTEGASNCSELAAQIRQPWFDVTTASAVFPGKPFPALAEFRNLPELFFRLIRTDPDEYQDKIGEMERDEFLKFLFDQYYVKSWSQTLRLDGDFQKHSAETVIPEVPEGYYVLLASADKDFRDMKKAVAFHGLWVTAISYLIRHNEHGGLDMYVLDRETGRPMKNVTVETWTRNYNYQSRKWSSSKTGEYITDENGFLVLSQTGGRESGRGLFLKMRTKTDLFITENLYIYPPSVTPPKTLLQTNFYTDRAIYRPGQTVWFKGVVMEKTGEKYTLKPRHTTTVVFRDVNYQEIASETFTTNEFGSFNGSFTTPSGVLTGTMTLANETGSVSFSVEEYRRPTFEITFDPVEGNYKLNETVAVKGKATAYAGNSLDGASVSYRVVRTARFPWYDWFWFRPFPESGEKEIAVGTTKTEADGSFTVSFIAEPDVTVPASDEPVFDYSVYADVTDMNGEMQSAVVSVSVGYTSLLLSSSLPEKVNLNTDTAFQIHATNLNGRNTPSEVKVALQRLKQPDRAFIPRDWARPDLTLMTRDEFHSVFPNDIYADENNPSTWTADKTLLEKTLNTGLDSILRIPESGFMGPGSYRLTLSSTDPFGQKVEKIQYFTAYDPTDKEMPVRAMDWFVPLKTSGEPGEKASFLIGSTEDDMNIIYEITVHDTLYSRSWLKLSDRQMQVEIPILEGFRGNFRVSFACVKHNRVFGHSESVTVPWTNKKLDIAFETFRDKITPGAKEEWRIRITGPGKKAAEAEFLATLYDASLDVFAEHAWHFDILPQYFSHRLWESHFRNFDTQNEVWPPLTDLTGLNFKYRETDRLNWFGNGYLSGGYFGRYRGLTRDDLAMPMAGMVIEKAMDQEESLEMTTEVVDGRTFMGETTVNQQDRKQAPKPAMLQVRRDFRETAFFYPSLVTDSAGSVILKFTAPESLTRWKLMGLAYTKNLESGTTEKSTVTRKDLMVMPNPSRFVRQGDTLVFNTKVVNLSNDDLDVTVKLDLSDPVTLQPLNHYLTTSPHHHITTSPVSIPKGFSASVSWTLAIPADATVSLLQYRVTAAAGSFSDGEEKIIPILPNRMMVTETLPLPVRGTGTFDFRFDKLAKSATAGNTLKNYRLTLEFAANPVWYAIQALPSLNEITYKSADGVFAAYYSNALASFIAGSDPRIRSIFESWKKLTPDALLSNLEKNEDLKSALLQETPWVLEAKDETANKQKLGLYFDRNNLEDHLARNLALLQKMQLPNGAWAWFEGMPESRWVTQEIVTGLGRLHHLGVTSVSSDEKTLAMVKKALDYLDRELTRDYEYIKKYYPGKGDENHLSPLQIQYLYARSLFGPQSGIRNPQSEAYAYFRSQAVKYWLSQDLVLQGMIALALNRGGDAKTPPAILKSLREKALHSPEMGMYWAQDPGYFWTEAPVETQAMLIETFDEVGHDRESVDDMNVWLLKQKQTRMWNTRRATADACYALLLRGTDRLAEDPRLKIRIGSQEIDPSKFTDSRVEAGTGYFKLSWSGTEISPGMAEVKVTKASEGVAWGGLYWQYFENLDKITPHQTPLKVSREVFVERNSGTGPVLEKIQDAGCRMQDAGCLETGDKVKVRIVLSVDRDMEFVHMKDLRAAGLEPRLVSPSAQPFISSDGLSGYRFQDGLGYYQAVGDVGASFFFDYLPKGTYVFEYPLKTNCAGDFSNGITTVQCLYAPEFSAHSEGIRVVIK